MATRENKNLRLENRVYVSDATAQRFSDFEKSYLAVREKEKRVLSLDEIRRLPYPSKDSPDYELWRTRRRNIDRFLAYLSGKKNLRILDVGCGNGFFTKLLSINNQVVGLDVNLTELKQAAEVFPDKKIHWYYLDILNETLPEEKFDLITFCASFHYFSDPKAILEICRSLLKPGGEIHIIDSPFYSEQGQKEARERSLKYFRSMNVESMSNYYHHNSYSFLKGYSYRFKYKPNHFLQKIFRIKDSPFPWIIISL